MSDVVIAQHNAKITEESRIPLVADEQEHSFLTQVYETATE